MGLPFGFTYVHEKIWANHASHFINDLGIKLYNDRLLPPRCLRLSASSKQPEFWKYRSSRECRSRSSGQEKTRRDAQSYVRIEVKYANGCVSDRELQYICV